MKSLVFLRNTWKKWAAYHRDDEQVNGRWREPQTSVSPLSQPNSPYSSSRHCDDHPILRRNTSRFALDTACRAQDPPTSSLESTIRDCDQLPRLSTQLSHSSTAVTKKPTSSCTLSPKVVEDSVPYHESLSLYRVSQSLDVSDNLGSTSPCLTDRHPYISTNQARSTDTISSTTSSEEVQDPQKMTHTALDLVDAKPYTLYHTTRSMPYLPYEDEIKSTQTCSASSVDSTEDKFPLSLFPTPPPLIVRKKIPPPPLLLHNLPLPVSPQSSCDSTPVGTPTTPRFLSPRSPSQSIFGSYKRLDLGRRVASISPPPFSPPNSPLPSPPVHYEDGGRPLDYASRPLRSAYSSSNLKDALPLPAAHRLTFSESISDQSSLPIKRSRKPRPEGMQPERLQACLEAGEHGSLAAVENNVQWGYAF